MYHMYVNNPLKLTVDHTPRVWTRLPWWSRSGRDGAAAA